MDKDDFYLAEKARLEDLVEKTRIVKDNIDEMCWNAGEPTEAEIEFAEESYNDAVRELAMFENRFK